MLINIIGGDDLTLGETTQINDIIHDAVGDEAEIIFGAGNDAAMHGEVRVTVIATGFDRAVSGERLHARPAPRPRRGRRAQLPDHAPAAVLARRFSLPRAAAGAAAVPAAGAPSGPGRRAPAKSPEMEIPTFIRRQMD